MISLGEIRSIIEAALPGAMVQVQDLTGEGNHFEAVVVSAAFTGKGLVERHRLVYAPLQEAMAERIHALALKTYTPEEFKRIQGGQ